MVEKLEELERKIADLEARLQEDGYSVKKIVTSEVKRNFRIEPQAETQFAMMTALCVDTSDPWKQNRVRFFSPLFHKPDVPVKSLDFAAPISSMGGFDDSGLSWVPPAGSTLCLMFENGSRSTPFYIGTTWHRDRGADGQNNWGYPIQEYQEIHSGHRSGYLVGPNDGSQVLPPWNTESYNGIDLNSTSDFDAQQDAVKKKLTYPNIYGFKTPQKHMLKMVDGDYKCNHKHKRMEILSSCGNWMLFKDDHLHEFSPGGDDDGDCTDDSTCKNTKKNSKYFKNKNEIKPWQGVGTPQNTKCELKQSGIQLISLAGHTIIMDDSVDQPDKIPEWEKSLEPFNFGCTDKFTGKMSFVSSSGHRIEMDDTESDTEIRGEENKILIKSACGHMIELNDHSKSDTTSGERRAISIRSTSNHTFEMYDGQDLEQASPRKESSGEPKPQAKNGYVSLRSGYGLQILMEDKSSQEETENQSIMIYSPQKDNDTRGPHIFRMQETASGPGQVFLKVGGNYIVYTYDDLYTAVGSKDENPSDNFTYVSRNTLIKTEEYSLNLADVHHFSAKKAILLGAGEDCDIKDSDTKGPCWGPVLVYTSNGVVASDRIWGSASDGSRCITIFDLVPFHKCGNDS